LRQNALAAADITLWPIRHPCAMAMKGEEVTRHGALRFRRRVARRLLYSSP
jgi:hypothetical protein